MLFQKRKSVWGANNLLPNFSPLTRLDCNSCCVVGKEIEYQHAQRLPSDSGEQGWLTTLFSLRSRPPLLLLVREVLPRKYRHVWLLSFLWIHAQSQAGAWEPGLCWLVGLPAVLHVMELPGYVLHAGGGAARLLQHRGQWIHHCVVSISSPITLFLHTRKTPTSFQSSKKHCVMARTHCPSMCQSASGTVTAPMISKVRMLFWILWGWNWQLNSCHHSFLLGSTWRKQSWCVSCFLEK